MRRSDHHTYQHAYNTQAYNAQAYNAQACNARACNARAVVDADGGQLVLATHVIRCPVDAPIFLARILAMTAMTGLPRRVLADAGFANREAVAGLQQHGVEPLVALSRTQPH